MAHSISSSENLLTSEARPRPPLPSLRSIMPAHGLPLKYIEAQEKLIMRTLAEFLPSKNIPVQFERPLGMGSDMSYI